MSFLSRITTIQWALGVSLAFHALLLLVRFAAPEQFDRMFQDTPLEVVLVNASSKKAPEKAQAIAQRNLEGGGNADKGRATSPLPPSAITEVGDAMEESRKQVEQLMEQQMQLLASIRRELAKMPPPDPMRDMGDPTARERDEKRRQLTEQLAEIEKRVNEENARPRKRYISPATREEAYAGYYDALRRTIEARGTRDFPQIDGKKIYGELTMTVTVDARGRVVETEIVQSSGNKLLDQRARAIVRAAAPFGLFTATMRAQADQIVVVSRFKFSRDDALETTLSNR